MEAEFFAHDLSRNLNGVGYNAVYKKCDGVYARDSFTECARICC